MKVRTALVLAPGALAFAAPAQAQNAPHGSCYLSDGSQVYMRAFRNGSKIDERAICDERSGNYDIPMNSNGYQYYLSQYDWDWLVGMAGTEVLLVLVNKQTGQYRNLARL